MINATMGWGGKKLFKLKGTAVRRRIINWPRGKKYLKTIKAERSNASFQ